MIIFLLDLLCNILRTVTMSKITKEGLTQISETSYMIHRVAGLLAIVLMLFHALWATWILYKNDEYKKQYYSINKICINFISILYI